MKRIYENLFALIALFLLFTGILYITTRPSQAEYNHCMVTMTDKSVCESVNPNK